MLLKTFKISAILLLSLIVTQTYAQICHNLYPYAEGVVYDNNGHDLAAFIKSNKSEVASKSGKIKEFSQGRWGYVQIKNARVPSLNSRPDRDLNKDVNFDYSGYIDATLALCNMKDAQQEDDIKATWWARQCNNPEGPLVYTPTDDEDKLQVENIPYNYLLKEMETKQFTIVEYNSETYNQRDYDQLFKNYILIENGAIKDINDYKMMIEFYNNFLSKFTYVEDPLLENKSFITFFTGSKTKYVGYFNIVNNKLAGHIEPVKIEYERDRDTLVNNTFKKLTGSVVYVYGDDIFGLEKTILKYGHTHDIKLIRRNTDTTEKFNK